MRTTAQSRFPSRIKRKNKFASTASSQFPIVKILISLLIIFITAFSIWWINTKILRVKTISCQTNLNTACSEPVQAELNNQLGKHLFWSDFEPTFTKITTANSTYQQFNLTRQAPDKILISVELSHPAYIITEGQQQLIINQAGKIAPQPTKDLPLIYLPIETFTTINEVEQLDETLHQELLTFVGNIEASPQYHDIVKETHWHNSNHIELQLIENKQALLSLDNTDQQLTVLFKILPVPIDQDWQTIDLRFDKPILRL